MVTITLARMIYLFLYILRTSLLILIIQRHLAAEVRRGILRCLKVSLNVFPESKEIRDALYTLSTSFFEGNEWCMVVCSPSFLEDSARKISLDPVLKQYPGVKPLVLEWLDLTAIYDFAQDVLLDADVWPSIDHPYGDYGSSNSCIGNYIFDDTDFGYLSDEELDRPFRGQEIVVDDVIST